MNCKNSLKLNVDALLFVSH